MYRTHVFVLPVCISCTIENPLSAMARLPLQDGSTPLITASSYGCEEVVDRLIAARATVDAADKVVPPRLTPADKVLTHCPYPGPLQSPRLRRCYTRHAREQCSRGSRRDAGGGGPQAPLKSARASPAPMCALLRQWRSRFG